jgi:hypothetical protein
MAAEWHHFKRIAHGFIPGLAISPWMLIVCFRHIWSRRGFKAPRRESSLSIAAPGEFRAPLALFFFALPSPIRLKRGKSMGTVIASPGQLSVSSPIIRSKSDPFKAPAEALKHLCKLLVIKRQPVRLSQLCQSGCGTSRCKYSGKQSEIDVKLAQSPILPQNSSQTGKL